MRGEWYTTGGDGKGWLALLAVGAGVLLAGSGAVAAVSEFVIGLLIGFVALVVAAIVALVVLIRRNLRATPPPFTPLPRALPPPEATPLPSRPAQAIQGPQQLHVHFHGLTASEQAGQIAAIRQAGYAAWDQRETEGR